MLIGATCSLVACAMPALVVDRDYALVDPPQPLARADRIEVIEFFWFGCPHCADMHPRLKAWLRSRPDDVVVRYLPAIFKDGWRAAARLHFALDAMDELEQRAGAVFEAVQLDGIDLGDEAALLAWADRQGLDRARFIAAYHSQPVRERVEQAQAWPQAYQLRGVPAFVVDGRYLTSNGLTGSSSDTLAVLDRLIAKARAERVAAR